MVVKGPSRSFQLSFALSTVVHQPHLPRSGPCALGPIELPHAKPLLGQYSTPSNKG